MCVRLYFVFLIYRIIVNGKANVKNDYYRLNNILTYSNICDIIQIIIVVYINLWYNSNKLILYKILK